MQEEENIEYFSMNIKIFKVGFGIYDNSAGVFVYSCRFPIYVRRLRQYQTIQEK